jgi:hypothetical protein
MWQDWFRNGRLHPSVHGEKIPPYDQERWDADRDGFSNYLLTLRARNEKPSPVALNVYRFYQAASYHRHYVLRELLPAHGIVVV